MSKSPAWKTWIVLLAAALLTMAVPRSSPAHCDTLDGPVVKDARAALEKGDVTPALKWVTPADEPDIRAAFAKTLEVRNAGPAARELADRSFFETLVRIHRQGEGVPYSGLRSAGTDPGPGIRAADQALDRGSPDDLLNSMTARLAAEMRQRYRRAAETRRHADDSLQAGREYVEAYVTFVHFVERLHEDLSQPAAHEGSGEGTRKAAHSHP
jgi:hypothetical protein